MINARWRKNEWCWSSGRMAIHTPEIFCSKQIEIIVQCWNLNTPTTTITATMCPNVCSKSIQQQAAYHTSNVICIERGCCCCCCFNWPVKPSFCLFLLPMASASGQVLEVRNPKPEKKRNYSKRLLHNNAINENNNNNNKTSQMRVQLEFTCSGRCLGLTCKLLHWPFKHNGQLHTHSDSDTKTHCKLLQMTCSNGQTLSPATLC